MLPGQLPMIKLTLQPKHSRQPPSTVHLAQLPVDPHTGKRPPLLYLSRYNSTWFEVLAALHVAVLEGALEQMPKVYLCANQLKGPATGGHGSYNNTSGTRSTVDDGTAGVTEEIAPTIFLARLGELCELRRSGTLKKFDSNGNRRRSYTGYYDWQRLLHAERSGLLNSEVESALELLRRYEGQIEAILKTINLSKAASKAEAEYIFSTAHKYKGGEEGYVQIADDFIHIADGIRLSVVIDE
eukprot:GHUV01049004.1.p1 GENE.GHUV01049004.1~~GHUV01049004.1.p1  ORF type:complete len:241 (+),score=56.66 GHUV01049004.1:188-910(+)